VFAPPKSFCPYKKFAAKAIFSFSVKDAATKYAGVLVAGKFFRLKYFSQTSLKPRLLQKATTTANGDVAPSN
jgi:hypothetical protein